LGAIVALQDDFRKQDSEANNRWAQKASDLELTGKPRAFLLKHFGRPRMSRVSGSNDVFIYVPGPKLAIWNSYVEVVMERSTDTVLSRAANLD